MHVTLHGVTYRAVPISLAAARQLPDPLAPTMLQDHGYYCTGVDDVPTMYIRLPDAATRRQLRTATLAIGRTE